MVLFADLPPLAPPQGLGVNIHFTDPVPSEMARLAGPFRVARMDFAWGSTERAKGTYDFAAYDRLLAALDRAKVRPYWILDYGNDLYSDGSPRTPEARAAFCRWVAAAMARFRGHGVVWEMWNEPNISFWKPKPNVDEYVLLARAVGETVRRVAPKEILVGPATSGFDWAFLQRCLDAGLLKYWNAVSVHPYRQNEPESVEADWLRLRAMLDRAAPRRNVPIISGEWGYSEAWSGMTQERQAEYAARAYLTNLRCGVPISIWYDWKDDGPDPKDAESRFGSVGMDLAPKPAYDAFAKLANDLAGYAFVTRLESADPRRWTLLFRKGDSAKLALWTTATPETVQLLGHAVAVGHAPQVVEADSNAMRNLRGLPWVRYVPDAILEPAYNDYSVIGVGDAAYFQTTLQRALRPLRLRVEPGREGGTFVSLENPYGHAPITDILTADKNDPLVSELVPRRPSVSFPITPRAIYPMRVRLPEGSDRLRLRPGSRTSFLVPRFVDLPLDGVTAITDGDPKVRGTAEATKAQDGLRFAYEADPGWRFAELHPKDGAAEGRPTAYGIWAKGDGSGALLRMRYTDATGQTFQPDLGRLDGADWRYVSAPLDGSGGHWGGANDGTVHFPIRVSTLALIELPDRRGGKAAVTLARPTLAYAR